MRTSPKGIFTVVTAGLIGLCAMVPRQNALMAADESSLPVENAVLTSPPEVPPAITRKAPAKVIVKLEVIEKERTLDDGVTYTFWTFGGTVPGQFIRVRQGDLVEFHLDNNANNKMPHNIDLHAVTGPGGGAASSFTAPGHESVFSFTTLNPGLYIYHCATAPVGMHIANGMYGMILVEPPEGLPKVDHEYYVMQSEVYTKGKFGQSGLQSFDMEKAIAEHPEYVVFNGSVGALSGDNALKAKTGETVRLFVGNGGPNLTSSFHVIGEIFDRVFVEGGSAVNTNVQTTVIPPGGAAIVDFTVQVPGNYVLVDHAIFRTFNKGALGILTVAGEPNVTVYSGKQDDRVLIPEGEAIQSLPAEPAPAPKKKGPVTKADRIAEGEKIFKRICIACHQPTGMGIPHAFPPLAGSDFLNADVDRAIGIVSNGFQGKITVNGNPFNGIMPNPQLNDEQVANALTYVYSKWGNKGAVVTPDQVAKLRKTKKK